MKEVTVDGEVYVPKSALKTVGAKATMKKGLKYVLVRTYSAGVHVGYLQSRKGAEVVLRNARRIWYWDGAASLSQLAKDGTSKPSTCKFPCEVDEITLLGAIEIIECTKKAQDSIASVKVWEQ